MSRLSWAYPVMVMFSYRMGDASSRKASDTSEALPSVCWSQYLSMCAWVSVGSEGRGLEDAQVDMVAVREWTGASIVVVGRRAGGSCEVSSSLPSSFASVRLAPSPVSQLPPSARAYMLG